MRLVFLGTSGCVPTKKRNLSSIYLEFLDKHFLFDCGEGTQRQMRIAGINFMRIDRIFITHLHADHFLGLGGLIQSMDFMGREESLHLYGPEGLEQTIDHLLSMGTFKMDSMNIEVHEVKEGFIAEGENYDISCTPSIHTQGSIAYCFEEKPKRKFLKKKAAELGIPEGKMFSTLQKGHNVDLNGVTISPENVLSKPIPGRKIVYSGDTSFSEDIIRLAENADILIHDSSFLHSDLLRTENAAHSSARQAAEAAKAANVKKLFLTHISQRYPDAKPLEEEAREIFAESYVAEDFMSMKIEKHTK